MCQTALGERTSQTLSANWYFLLSKDKSLALGYVGRNKEIKCTDQDAMFYLPQCVLKRVCKEINVIERIYSTEYFFYLVSITYRPSLQGRDFLGVSTPPNNFKT